MVVIIIIRIIILHWATRIYRYMYYTLESKLFPFTFGDILSEFNINPYQLKFIFYIVLELKNEGFSSCPDSGEAINCNSSFIFSTKIFPQF